MKIANFVLQLLLILSFVNLFTWMKVTNEQDVSIYLLWLLFAGSIQAIGTLYKNIKYRLKHRGYLIHLIVSLVYIGIMIYLANSQYYSFTLFGEWGIMYLWLPVPFALACFYTYCAYAEIDKRRKTMLEI